MNTTPKNSLEAMQVEIDRRKAGKPMFPHDVPEVEPPLGTVAVFNLSFQSGAGSSTNMLVRTEDGWKERPDSWQARSWQSLTDLEFINGETLERNPNSTALYIAVQVQIIESPALSAVRAVADDLQTRGDALEEKGNNGSIYSHRAEGRGIGYREAARSIYKALGGE